MLFNILFSTDSSQMEKIYFIIRKSFVLYDERALYILLLFYGVMQFYIENFVK